MNRRKFLAGATVALSNIGLAGCSQRAPEPSLVEKPASAMVPTIADFDAGWMMSSTSNDPDNGTASTTFYNTETDAVVIFDVAAFESVKAARKEYDARSQAVGERGLSTDSVTVGDEGILYKYDRTFIVVEFRVQNVVGRIHFDGPRSFSPETNSKRFARMLEDEITN